MKKCKKGTGVFLTAQTLIDDLAGRVETNDGRKQVRSRHYLVSGNDRAGEPHVGPPDGCGAVRIDRRSRGGKARKPEEHLREGGRGRLHDGWRPDVRITQGGAPRRVALDIRILQAWIEQIDIPNLVRIRQVRDDAPLKGRSE